MDEKRAGYMAEMKEKFEKWNIEIDKLQAQTNQAPADILIEYRTLLEGLKTERKHLEEKLSELQTTGDSTWEESKSGLEKSWKSLGDSIHLVRMRIG